MIIALKIDVDTYRGTRDGVRPLARLLGDKGLRGSFFFSMGPDNMGRHLWRLLKPAFLVKMIRSRAASLYGMDILFKGTFWPGPLIGKHLTPVFRETAAIGHECGLHAWDHHAWQQHGAQDHAVFIEDQIQRGFEALATALGRAPDCSAAAGWQCGPVALKVKSRYPFRYNSDCRGTHPFRPMVDGLPLCQPQIPTTLPTYDELIGHQGCTPANYNEKLLNLLRPDRPNVLTIHAEAEGIVCFDLFRDFLDRVMARGISIIPLGDLLEGHPERLPEGQIVQGSLPGRQGTLALQA